MENFVISANAILPMFLVMALGYGARCLGWIHREEISNINKVAFRTFLPCLLYYNVYCSDLSGSFDPLLIAYAVGGVLLSFALALGYTLLMEKLPERRGVMIQGMFRSNYVIMGIPVATALLGAFFQFSGIRRYVRELTAVVAAKLIVFPALFLGLGALLGFRDAAFVSLLGVFASPTAVNSFTMAQQMGGDAELAGDTVVVTSAVSMLTMFLWVFLFKSLGMF